MTKEEALASTKKFDAPYDLRYNTNPVVNNTDGSIVGYKYFNFDAKRLNSSLKLRLRLIPEGIDGTILIMADRPWTSQGGKEIGKIELKADMPKTSTELTAAIDNPEALVGLHAIFFKFSSATKNQSICTIEDFVFE